MSIVGDPHTGVSYEKLGRTQKAIKAYRRYLSLEPSGPVATAVRERIAQLTR